MPEGPAGGPRPFARDALEGAIIFTAGVSNEVVTVPKEIREQEGLRVGEILNVTVYPLYLFEFRAEHAQSAEIKIGSQFRLSMSRIDRATTMEGMVVTTDKVLVAIHSVTVPQQRDNPIRADR